MSIRFICGANTQELEGVSGKKLGEVKDQLVDVLNIPSPVQCILGGQSVSDDYELKEGEQIEFVRPAGDKG